MEVQDGFECFCGDRFDNLDLESIPLSELAKNPDISRALAAEGDRVLHRCRCVDAQLLIGSDAEGVVHRGQLRGHGDPAAAAPDAGAAVGGITVVGQRPAHGPDDVIADLEGAIEASS